MSLNRVKCDLTVVRVDAWPLLITCLHIEVAAAKAHSSRPEELPEIAQREVQHTGNFGGLLLLLFVSFIVVIKGILLCSVHFYVSNNVIPGTRGYVELT